MHHAGAAFVHACQSSRAPVTIRAGSGPGKASMATEGDNRYAFVLVHGTFAANAQWSQPGSPLGNMLKAEFPGSTIAAFNWSGENSHAARERTGREFHKALDALSREDGDRKIAIISHSHGGNVALYALGLASQELQQRIHRIIFLGTPFLKISPLADDALRSFASVVATLLIVLLHGTVLLGFAVPGILFAGYAHLLIFAQFYSTGLFLLTLYRWFTRRKGEPDQRKLRIKLQNWIFNSLKHSQKQRQQWWAIKPLRHPSLVCAIAWDEAGLWLRTLDSIQRWSHRIGNTHMRIVDFFKIYALSIAGLLILMQLVGLVIDTESIRWNIYMLFAYFMIIAIVSLPLSIVIIALIRLLSRSHGFGYGWEGAFGFLHTSIEAIEGPAADDPAQRFYYGFKPPESRFDLRHSVFYRDLSQWKPVVAWLREEPAAPPIRNFRHVDVAPPGRSFNFNWAVLSGLVLLALLLAVMGINLGGDRDRTPDPTSYAGSAPKETLLTSAKFSIPGQTLVSHPLESTTIQTAATDPNQHRCLLSGTYSLDRPSLEVFLAEGEVSLDKMNDYLTKRSAHDATRGLDKKLQTRFELISAELTAGIQNTRALASRSGNISMSFKPTSARPHLLFLDNAPVSIKLSLDVACGKVPAAAK
jgi:pimeloyl-ACP methyl ester carboxylesterase